MKLKNTHRVYMKKRQLYYIGELPLFDKIKLDNKLMEEGAL